MEQLHISAKLRERKAKGDNRRLRREGEVPAVVYGGQQVPQSVSINHHELELFLRGARHSNVIFNLTLDSAGLEQAIIREIQRHPVTNRMVHIDFQRVDLEQEVQVSVVIHVTGSDPKGVKNGGVLEHVNRTVEVLCKPLSIPKRLDADLSNLDLNQTFHVSELTLPEGVTVVDTPETPLFTILPPRTEAAAEAATPGAAEPEVVAAAKKKPEDEAKDKGKEKK